MSAASLRARYLGDSVATASPQQLLVMLYDRLALDLERAELAVSDGDRARANEELLHAQEIVLELLASLQVDVWEGGPRLAALYDWLVSELIQAQPEGRRPPGPRTAGRSSSRCATRGGRPPRPWPAGVMTVGPVSGSALAGFGQNPYTPAGRPGSPETRRAATWTAAPAHDWPEVLDELEGEVLDAQETLARGRAEEIAAWGRRGDRLGAAATGLGPLPEDLRERAARLLQHQLAVAERLVERITQSQKQRDVAARMSYGAERARRLLHRPGALTGASAGTAVTDGTVAAWPADDQR